MFQVDQPTAATALPTPAAAGTQGYFTNGNPGTGVAATILDADFMNMVQQELINVVTGGGLTPSKTTYNQVLLAIKQMIASLAPGVIGAMRNAKMSVTTPSATATLTADQIVVASALNGLQYIVPSFSQTINLGTTGAGGMDTGTAPLSGYVALYAIYNPTTNTKNIVATNAATLQGNVYGGANMPAGYAASALVGVWPTNGSGQFKQGIQLDRSVSFANLFVLNAGAATTYTAFSLSTAIPVNARSVKGTMQVAPTSGTANGILAMASDTGGTDLKTLANASLASGQGLTAPFSDQSLITAQTLYYNVSGTSMAGSIGISGYTF